jgi:hypothetical protein
LLVVVVVGDITHIFLSRLEIQGDRDKKSSK